MYFAVSRRRRTQRVRRSTNLFRKWSSWITTMDQRAGFSNARNVRSRITFTCSIGMFPKWCACSLCLRCPTILWNESTVSSGPDRIGVSGFLLYYPELPKNSFRRCTMVDFKRRSIEPPHRSSSLLGRSTARKSWRYEESMLRRLRTYRPGSIDSGVPMRSIGSVILD